MLDWTPRPSNDDGRGCFFVFRRFGGGDSGAVSGVSALWGVFFGVFRHREFRFSARYPENLFFLLIFFFSGKEKVRCFGTAVPSIFRPAPKDTKGAPLIFCFADYGSASVSARKKPRRLFLLSLVFSCRLFQVTLRYVSAVVPPHEDDPSWCEMFLSATEGFGFDTENSDFLRDTPKIFSFCLSFSFPKKSNPDRRCLMVGVSNRAYKIVFCTKAKWCCHLFSLLTFSFQQRESKAICPKRHKIHYLIVTNRLFCLHGGKFFKKSIDNS